MESQDISKTVDKADRGGGVGDSDGEMIGKEERVVAMEGEDKMDGEQKMEREEKVEVMTSGREEDTEEGEGDVDGSAPSMSCDGVKKERSVKRRGVSGHHLNK